MPGFFEALKNFKPQKRKPNTVTIQGQSVVVTLEKKLEVMRHGESAYMWKTPTEFVLKPRPKPKTGYKVLKKLDKGYTFYDNDPYYPKEVVEGGYSWEHE